MPDPLKLRSVVGAIFLLLILSACATPPPTIWAPVMTLAETEQSHAPALWVQGDVRLAAWIGADSAGVHHDARLVIGNTPVEPVTLPLPPRRPDGQLLLPAMNDQYHLLWLDAAENGELRLYTALINPDLSIERGPVALSDQRVGRFSAIASGDGQAMVVWSGGLVAEPIVYMQMVSARGIPEPAVPMLINADWPALIQANDGTRHLIWQDTRLRLWHHGQLTAGGIRTIGATPNTLELAAGDRLHNLQLGLDATHLYLFWNITRQSGTDEVWTMARTLDDNAWSEAKRLGIGTPSDSFIETGLNTGPVQAVTNGENGLTWAAPLAGQFDVLPVAVSRSNELGIVYLQHGDVVGYQTVTTLQMSLIGLPALHTDRDRYLYIAWAEPSNSGKAQLKLADTRP